MIRIWCMTIWQCAFLFISQKFLTNQTHREVSIAKMWFVWPHGLAVIQKKPGIIHGHIWFLVIMQDHIWYRWFLVDIRRSCIWYPRNHTKIMYNFLQAKMRSPCFPMKFFFVIIQGHVWHIKRCALPIFWV